MAINIYNLSGEIIYTYLELNESIDIDKLYNNLYEKFLYNFKLIFENNITLIKLPTQYLTIYDNYFVEIIKLNIERINNPKYNIKYYSIKDLLNDLKIYINDEYCILSQPELYIYIYTNININNIFNNTFSNTELLNLLYDDNLKILECDHKILIIKLLSPIVYGAIQILRNELDTYDIKQIINSYLISKSKCTKHKYKCIGKITEAYVSINKFNEKTYTFVINYDLNNIIRYFYLDSLYFIESCDKYNDYTIYFNNEINTAYDKLKII
jgi:hypothetical protein